jgi:hypothetical protein
MPHYVQGYNAGATSFRKVKAQRFRHKLASFCDIHVTSSSPRHLKTNLRRTVFTASQINGSCWAECENQILFSKVGAIMNVFVRSVAGVALLALLTCGLTGCSGSNDKMGDSKMMDDKKMDGGKMMDGKMSDGKMGDGKMMDGKMMDDKSKMK